MQIRRTACSGVLLTLDGTRLLLDGVGEQILTYPATPEAISRELSMDPPNGVLITHRHKDHYDASFVSSYVDLAAGPVIGPAQIPNAVCADQRIGSLQITCVESRHIGKTDGTQHISFVIRGSQCVWLTGDASPLMWRGADLPKPDVLIAPYAYCNTAPAWELSKSLGGKTVVLVHMPEENEETKVYYDPVRETVGAEPLYIPAMEETLEI